MSQTINLTLGDEYVGRRLDHILTELLPQDLSRSRIQDLIKEGCVTSADKVIKQPAFKFKSAIEVAVVMPDIVPSEIKAEKIELDIVYEDSDLLVINKLAGLVVHPGAGNRDGTLVNALLHHCKDSLSGIGGVERPGIVHRLDKDTSGLMLVAKNDKAHRHLSAQLSDRTLKRTYWAYVWGMPVPPVGRIETLYGRAPNQRIKMSVLREGGKEAITDYKLNEFFYDGLYSLIECQLQTGRTHQIRVHMMHIGCPLIGDPLYYRQKTAIDAAINKADIPAALKKALEGVKRQALHAKEISFIHPVSGKQMSFSSNLPDDFSHFS